jgi:predicted DNA-binding transcriptional regulator AlpA
MENTDQEPLRLLTRKEVMARVRRSYPWIWGRMREGTFPRSREQGGGVVWIESEIEAYVRNLPVKKFKGANEP